MFGLQTMTQERRDFHRGRANCYNDWDGDNIFGLFYVWTFLGLLTIVLCLILSLNRMGFTFKKAQYLEIYGI